MKTILTSLAITLSAAALPAQQPTLQEVLDQVQTATGLGATEPGHGWQLLGNTERLGNAADWSLTFDQSGRFVEQYNGIISSTTAFDGVTMSERDWTDVPRVLVLGDREKELISGWLVTSMWTYHADSLHLSVNEQSSQSEVILDFTYGNVGLEGSIQIDTNTWLPTRCSYGLGDDRNFLLYSEWQNFDGQTAPGLIRSKGHGDVHSHSITSAKQITLTESMFAPQLHVPEGTSFDASLPNAIQVKRAPTGHLLVRPTVNGKDVGWFIFDSGAGVNCIGNHLSEKLGLSSVGSVEAQGVGGSEQSQLFKADSLQLGPIAMAKPVMMGLDLEFLELIMGVPIGGIIGYGLVARCVVELDAVKPSIGLFDPTTYALENGAWTEALIYKRHPCVRGKIEGNEGVFCIDTGAAGAHSLSVHRQAVIDWNLLDGRATTDGQAGGVGGMLPVKIGTLKSVEIAGLNWTEVAADFALEDVGAFSDRYTIGNVGVTLFDKHILVLDYPHRRLAITKTSASNADG